MIKVPLTPLAVRMLCAVVAPVCASALENSVATFADVELLVPLDEELEDAEDPEVPEVLLDGVVGWAELFLEP